MKTPVNRFKQALTENRAQIGLWLGMASSYSAEMCAMAGFDWLLIDGEHAPNNLQTIQQQLQAIAAYPANHAVARVPVGDTALIKQYLDLGAETLLIPMIDTPEQAAQCVQAMRYPQNDGQRWCARHGRRTGFTLGHVSQLHQRSQCTGLLVGASRNPRSLEKLRSHCQHARC
jgi:2-keto-3-deoxy-L-rhamnonate aldolase RhmA